MKNNAQTIQLWFWLHMHLNKMTACLHLVSWGLFQTSPFQRSGDTHNRTRRTWLGCRVKIILIQASSQFTYGWQQTSQGFLWWEHAEKKIIKRFFQKMIMCGHNYSQIAYCSRDTLRMDNFQSVALSRVFFVIAWQGIGFSSKINKIPVFHKLLLFTF